MANTQPTQAKESDLQTLRESNFFPAQKIHESDVRLFVENFARKASIPAKWSFRMQLIADELFINAIDYGTEKETDEIEIAVERENDQIRIAVTDPGKAGQMTPGQIRQKIDSVQTSHDPLSESGKGISLIVHQWANQLDIESVEGKGLRITARIILLKE